MVIIGQRIIEYLKTDATLVTLLGANTNILPMYVSDRKSKFVVVSTNVGESGNTVPLNRGTLTIDVIVSKTIVNAHKTCIDIAKEVDDFLNRKENNLTSLTYTVYNFVRLDSTGLNFDNDTGEYWYSMDYSFIIAQ